MIDQNTKELIKNELDKRVAHIGSGKKASVELNISNATVSNILNNKWELLSDEMLRKVAASLNLTMEENWKHANTATYEKLTGHLVDVRLHSLSRGLICHPGSGKTHAIRRFSATHKNVIVVKCVELMKVRDFYKEILKSLGKEAESYNLYEIQQQVVRVISSLENPIIIIDELERVKDIRALISQYVDLYNMLEDICGFALFGTSVLQSLFTNGINKQKANWNTAYDRVASKWIAVTPPSEKDVFAIIKANGINDTNAACSIVDDCLTKEGNYTLRRVKIKVHASKKKGAI